MSDTKEIYLAGGCFWGVQKYLSLLAGVVRTEVGYANGTQPNPTYEEVCAGNIHFAETVKVTYDPSIIGLSELLEMFYKVIDPTSVNHQGGDTGEQYRTGVYYTDAEDYGVINGSLILLGESLDKPVAVELKELENFYPAETYHQEYLDKNPGGYCHISPRNFALARAFQPRAAEERLRSRLTEMQYEVTQRAATEPPFQNEYWDKFEPGIYVDIVDGTPLFVSSEKFESGCGWPSFSRPISNKVLREQADYSFGRDRTEVRGSKSNSHLGHVFDDGPLSGGGLRYCINSAALRFIPRDKMAEEGYGDYLNLLEEGTRP